MLVSSTASYSLIAPDVQALIRQAVIDNDESSANILDKTLTESQKVIALYIVRLLLGWV